MAESARDSLTNSLPGSEEMPQADFSPMYL